MDKKKKTPPLSNPPFCLCFFKERDFQPDSIEYSSKLHKRMLVVEAQTLAIAGWAEAFWRIVNASCIAFYEFALEKSF